MEGEEMKKSEELAKSPPRFVWARSGLQFALARLSEWRFSEFAVNFGFSAFRSVIRWCFMIGQKVTPSGSSPS